MPAEHSLVSRRRVGPVLTTLGISHDPDGMRVNPEGSREVAPKLLDRPGVVRNVAVQPPGTASG
jgi:hypothetical protein